ncbi:Type cbb3 cytochrome oxidase biogenesis protein CcoG, involved in Cu oxidation [hydrothermal vent metagenome]|uniref:Type cbb3 cytochrome oxidase biogenesis protein CcoG, involved in Cu oxidation n=1 Tax=hydrothermal vent metagenome TaxID=652676 RepID=A0A3B0Z7I0_9ZZZZ
MHRPTRVMEEQEEVLYEKHAKVYPREVDGIFSRLRLLGVAVLLGLFYGIAWLPWDDRQAVLLDLPARKFYIFGLTFWPQDFFFFAWLLIIAALALFFFTALAGRLWCGYACPQTVWTELFLWIERKVEGTRNQQIKRDKAGLSTRKLRVKFVKHFLWVSLSLYTGFTFVGYFTPIRELSVSLIQFSLGPWETFWVLFYGFATYGNAGWLREQVCIYMCPYARFQSAMFDKDTLVISYDNARGDPRGSRKRHIDSASAGLGDCVDCTLCVQVCPTGIDIRDGLQYQCIGCAACIDACDQVMDKMGYTRGLIRYTTEQAMAGLKTRLLRPRIIMYLIVLVALSLGLVSAITQRIPLELDIIRDRNSLYRETREGLVENVYILKLINMDDKPHPFRITVSGLEGMELSLESPVIEVAAGTIRNLPVSVRVDPVVLEHTSNAIEFTLQAVDSSKLSRTETARFLGPVTR